jgi:hypothetical protein
VVCVRQRCCRQASAAEKCTLQVREKFGSSREIAGIIKKMMCLYYTRSQLEPRSECWSLLAASACIEIGLRMTVRNRPRFAIEHFLQLCQLTNFGKANPQKHKLFSTRNAFDSKNGDAALPLMQNFTTSRCRWRQRGVPPAATE